MFIVHFYIELQDFYKRRYGGNRCHFDTFSEDQQKTFVSIKDKLKPQEQEGRKEGRQTVATTSDF